MSGAAAVARPWRAARRLAVTLAAFPRGVETRIDRAGRIAREELAPSPARLRTAMRIALICSLGTGLIAVMHIQSVLGAYTLWGLTSTPTVALRPMRALMLIVVIGFAMAISVPIAGILVQAPWLFLPFIGAAAAIFSYLINFGIVGSYWLFIEILSLGTLYTAVFTPYDLGWPSAYTFAGVTLSVVVICLFDMVLWPDPAENALCDSIAMGFERNRINLALAGRGYLDEDQIDELPSIASVSILPLHLPLLNRAHAENPDSRRYAELLAAVTVDERMYMEIGRLVVQAREPVDRTLRDHLRPEIEAVLTMLDEMMARVRDHAKSGLRMDVAWPERRVEDMNAALEVLESRAAAVTSAAVSASILPELTNLTAFIATLRMLSERLTRPPESMPMYPIAIRAPRLWESFPRDPERIRYCLKMGIAIMAVVTVGLTTQRADLGTIVWTALIVGLPTYGATLRKMVLRIGGVIVGGIFVLLAMIIVSPNFETVLAFTIAFFIALYVAAYAGLSSGRVNYLGKQTGTTFVLAYASLAPSADIYTPLWRLWAVFLGITVTTVVFLTIWPEYARDALIKRLTLILRETMTVLPGTGEQAGNLAIQAAAARIIETLAELLGTVDDARLEGRRSGIDPDGVIESSGTLRRVGYNLAMICLGRITAPRPALEDGALAAQLRCETDVRGLIEYWLNYFTTAQEAGTGKHLRLVRPSPPPLQIGEHLKDFEDRIAVSNFATIAGWPRPARDSILAELQIWRRVAGLLPDLNSNLSRVRPV